jgi:acyl-CoA thioesterase
MKMPETARSSFTQTLTGHHLKSGNERCFGDKPQAIISSEGGLSSGKEDQTMNLEELAKRIFLSQSFSQYLGAELIAVGDGSANISLVIREHHTQQHGFVHGGVISYLADNALTFAGGLALGGDALTAEFKINFVRPAKGSTLLAQARTLSTGKRQAVCQCKVVCDKTLVAVAQGTIVAAHG